MSRRTINSLGRMRGPSERVPSASPIAAAAFRGLSAAQRDALGAEAINCVVQRRHETPDAWGARLSLAVMGDEAIGSSVDRRTTLFEHAILRGVRNGYVDGAGPVPPRPSCEAEELFQTERVQRLEQALGEAATMFQAEGDHGRAAFVAAVRALVRFAPPMPREQYAVIENGLKLIVDPHSAVHQAWSRVGAAERPSPNSIQWLEFKGEIAAFVHVLWMVLGPGRQKNAKEAVYRIGKSKAARLGLCDRQGEQKRERSDGFKIGWRVRTVGTYYESVRKRLPLLCSVWDGQPVLLTMSDLSPAAFIGSFAGYGAHPRYPTDVMRCAEVLFYCQLAIERGENLRTYVEHLAERVFGATLLPPSETLD
jgi:hypothetical protein